MTFATLQVSLPDRRYGRVFAATPRDLGDEAVTRFVETFLDEDDVRREALLQALFREGVVHAWLHPGDDHGDVIHVYLQSVNGGPRLFACVVVSRDRLEAMLSEAQYVLEGFTLQVVDVRHLTLDALCAAVGAWAERCVPSTAAPAFVMTPWTEEPTVELSTRTVVLGVNARPHGWAHAIERAIGSDARPTPGMNRRLPPASMHQASP